MKIDFPQLNHLNQDKKFEISIVKGEIVIFLF